MTLQLKAGIETYITRQRHGKNNRVIIGSSGFYAVYAAAV
jgi:hypothetical protein